MQLKKSFYVLEGVGLYNQALALLAPSVERETSEDFAAEREKGGAGKGGERGQRNAVGGNVQVSTWLARSSSRPRDAMAETTTRTRTTTTTPTTTRTTTRRSS